MEMTSDILSQALALSKPTIKIEDTNMLLVHKEYQRIDIPAVFASEKPMRTVLSQKIKNKNDFVEFVKEYQEEGTKLFFDESSVMAVFNYTKKDTPDFGDSRATLGLEYTTALKTFYEVAKGKHLNQKQLVRVLKELEKAITSHDAIDIVMLAQTLQSVQKVNSSITNTSRAVTIDAEIKGGKHESVTLPEKLTFKLPVFKNDIERETEFVVEVFADFEGNDFGVNLICYRIDEIIEETTRAMLEDIKKELGEVKAYQI
jgi:uncharacterized protein YfdQ (DUF2303 family)